MHTEIIICRGKSVS